ncbi:uncharacterized protein LOC133183890 [Saccostrea echinata]|uniref:uncharacterized protein LOC133183890 n=1 Tax=Saccostrea echinata TaxID=191078 RepID=UPI002A82D15C|nr:uncharacterized protein LOC133183890 [Saccostrea echinata]XP_061174765.1 uncharacterized protein LOC133183890 [Saccostrea echinata]
MSSSSSSSSSGIFQTENRAATQISRLKQEYDRRLLHYEKEFDVSLSRMINRERGLKESMLAYTERMRKMTNTKNSVEGMLSNDSPLYVRAKHIPKIPLTKNKTRRPASFDELIGKNAKSKSNKPRRDKPKSASRLSLPSLPERYNKNSHQVKISFVSASDLYDIVDFSIRNKGNKEDTLRYIEMDNIHNHTPSPTGRPLPGAGNRKASRNISKSANNESPTPKNPKDFSTLPTLPPIESSEKEQDSENSDTDSDSLDLNKANVEAFKRRPNRAKRMQINKPDLADIPENDVASQKRSAKSERTLPSPPPKQSPRNVLNLQSQLVAIPEHQTPSDELLIFDKKKVGKLPRRENGQNVTPMVRLEPFKNVLKEPEDNTDQHLKMKLKAQKRFKKLIFLRDVPDRHHRL